jgi:nitrite reductase/ring-hydroxylating ferredoxin subunit
MKPRLIDPYPHGWFAAAISSELRAGQIISRPFMGQDIILYRTASGIACASDPYCPHLGAHFGFGGSVEGELLRCPFHAFCYDRDGACVSTGYGTKPPPKARLKMWQVREVNGVVLVWHGDTTPTWQVPPLPLEGWTPLIHHTARLNEHAQETVENSVDLGHFAIVHGYHGVRITRPISTEGEHLSIAYAANRPLPHLSRLLPGLAFDFQYDLDVYGLGYSLVHVTVPRFGLLSRLFILATPVDADYIDLTMALSVRQHFDHPLLRALPAALLSPIVAQAILGGLVHDAGQDFPIWQNKRYLESPALAEGDGPIGRFRYWSRQFYSETAELSTVVE